MILRQVSVFLETGQGRLAPVVRHLAERGVNLRALMLAETDRFGIVRFIADDIRIAVEANFNRRLCFAAVAAGDNTGIPAAFFQIFD